MSKRETGSAGSVVDSVVIVGQELRRRNSSALAMDVLYLFTTAFLATLAAQGLRPAAVAFFPLAVFLYFAWKSTTAFLVANLIAIVVAVVATETGISPL
ncbi:hypothetical protein [Natrarchaeobius chitinivorans]|uniref:Uncharacterized protein n=1 Tax=Natrarchaeobius chitinivorans TaxID=1679083 RepID=A0A3N6MJJ1_NATCH|nr:hypothetical protein [Natrarchaeobius chitinivorans]RQG94366.1 hypothetical protein EA473_11710 [Natrarchaeobius chitinivorans]